jgi:hypothetical protein
MTELTQAIHGIKRDIASLREDLHQLCSRPNDSFKSTHRDWSLQQLEPMPSLDPNAEEELACETVLAIRFILQRLTES